MSISAITLLTAIAGVAIATSQWRKNSTLQRTKFVHEVLSKFQYEEDVTTAFYLIVNKKLNLKKDFKKLDKLLIWLTYVCYLKKTRCISKEEFRIIEYPLFRVLKSNAVKGYLEILNRKFYEHGVKCTYYHLIMYGLENEMLKKEDFPNFSVSKIRIIYSN